MILSLRTHRGALRHAAVSLLVALASVGARAPSLGAQDEDVNVGLVREALASGKLRGARWSRLNDVQGELRQVYDSVGWRPLWLRDGRPTNAALSVVRYLSLVEGVGLHPADYDAAVLESLARSLADSGASPQRAASFEALMSVAVARVLATLQWGRVKPSDAHESFRIARDDYDLAGAVRTMAAGTDPVGVFNAAEPSLLHYRLLKAELAQQRELARDSTSRAAEKRMATRIEQLELSLERWRWLPHAFPGRVILVNIPGFRLHAFNVLRGDSTDLFSMDVVVGKAFDHKTPVFTRELEYLAFSPYWEVPPSIARKEIRPKARQSAGYLARNHYVLLRNGSEVPATSANIDAIGSSVNVRQRPGEDNALGQVKFIFPNPHNVYMHDTPVQSVFDLERRDLSHGCIRLSEPVLLAQWVLRDRPEWTAARLDSAMSRSTPLDVTLTERIPVFVLYGTAVAERSGEIRFFRDIYGHDRRLLALLARGYPYPR